MKNTCTSIKSFGMLTAVIVTAFVSGAVISCKRAESDDKFVLVTGGEDIEVKEGLIIKIQRVSGDTLIVKEISDDDCRSMLEEHGQG